MARRTPTAQFDLSMTGVPDISFTEFEGEWTLAVHRKKPQFGPAEDEIEEGLRGAQDTLENRTVQCIQHELTFLSPRRRFDIHGIRC
jgi:hypothetical protein